MKGVSSMKGGKVIFMKTVIVSLLLFVSTLARANVFTMKLSADPNCNEPVLVQGYTSWQWGYVYIDPGFSFICYPGDVNVPNYVVVSDPHSFEGGGYYVAPGIFEPIYQSQQTLSIGTSCSSQSPLGSKPDDQQDMNNNTNHPCGMPVYSISEPYVSVWLHDEPVGYQPSVGSKIALRLDYDQREATNGYNPNWFGFGKKWESGWSSHVSLNTADGNGVVSYPNGGTEEYSANTVDILTQSTLSGNTNNGFTLTKSDGSMEVYGFIVTNTTGAFEEAFLTKQVNAQGQATFLNYFGYSPGPNPVIRLAAIVDGDGRTNWLYYNSSSTFSSNLVSQVTDAFGRTANLAYNNNGDLTNIVDAVTNSTVLYYDTNDWVTNMVTPYGATAFAITDNGTNLTAISRAVLVTRPDTSHELYLNEDMAPGIPNSYSNVFLPNTMSISNMFDDSALNFHDTFHWGPRQYANLSTTTMSLLSSNDFLKADMKHWLADGGTFNASCCLSFERKESPDNGGTVEGQKIWYDYAGKNTTGMQGTWNQPSLIAQVLPDGTSRFEYYIRNSYGLVATDISTYSVNGTVLLRTNVYSYAANNIDLITEANALGVQVVSNAFNAYHEITNTYDALGERTLLFYNTNQQLAEVIYPNGLTVTNIYGPYNLLASTITLGYKTNSFTYTDDLVASSTDSRGLTVNNTWDNLNRLTGTSYPDGSAVSNKYTILDLTGSKDRQGNWTRYGYDSMERLTTVTNAIGNVTTYNYCTCGALESIIDAQTNVTSFNYDNEGNRTNFSYPDGYFVDYNYNLSRQVVGTSDSSGNNVTNVYNNQGLLISSANSAGLLVSNVYDALDRITNSVDANHVSVTNIYDNLNRILARQYPDGGIESFGYTLNYSGPTSYTNQITNIVDYAYDLLNRKTNEVHVGVSTNGYAFDGPGDLLTLTDGNSHSTTWIYDQYGRVMNKLDASSNTNFIYQYDSDNRITNRWTPAKGNTAYAYDGVGNLTNVSYPVSPAIHLNYDTLNRLSGMVDGVGTTAYSYDQIGQLASEGGLWPNDTVSYNYANRLRTGMNIQAPNAPPWAQSYGYDFARRLTTLSSPVGTFGYAYDPVRLQRVDQLNLPNGADITNTFDSVARMLSTKLLNSSSTVLDAYTYVYNQAGQRTSVARTAGDFVNYTYDNEGELKTAIGKEIGGTTNRWQEQFGYVYDGAGNLYQRTNYSLLQTFGANNLNELTTLTNAGQLTVAGSTTSQATNVMVNSLASVLYADRSFASTNQSWVSGNNTYTAIAKDAYGRSSTNGVTVSLQTTNGFSYDLDGNLLSDGTRNFAYDDENELIGAWVANNWSNNFVYDGKMRRRIERDYGWIGGSWTETNEVHFIYDGNVVVQERNANNLPTVTYARGNDLSGTLQGAGGIGGLLARTDMGQWIGDSAFATSFYHADGNGNVTGLMYPNGALAAKYLYDPVGNTLAQYGTLAGVNNYRYSSKEWNANSGSYYYLYRYYNPNLQKWLSRDKSQEAGGINLYNHVGNDSVNCIDPRGLWTETFTLGDGLGAQLNFGYNGGQYSVGFQGGPLDGVSSSFDPKDSGSGESGFAFASQTSVTLPGGFGGNVSTGPDGNSASVGHPVAGGLSVNDGTDGPSVSMDYGDSAGASAGFIYHFHKQPILIWQCIDSTGDYLESSPTSPGPWWTLVRTIEQ